MIYDWCHNERAQWMRDEYCFIMFWALLYKSKTATGLMHFFLPGFCEDPLLETSVIPKRKFDSAHGNRKTSQLKKCDVIKSVGLYRSV